MVLTVKLLVEPCTKVAVAVDVMDTPLVTESADDPVTVLARYPTPILVCSNVDLLTGSVMVTGTPAPSVALSGRVNDPLMCSGVKWLFLSLSRL